MVFTIVLINRIEQVRVDDDKRFLAINEDGGLAEPHPMMETSYYKQALEDVLLLNEAGNDFDEEKIAIGELTPVFFGSALTNFGVQTFLETFLQFSPPPQPRITKDKTEIDPYSEEFSGFIFKIQANMNPMHRDRIAFVRIVSGEVRTRNDCNSSAYFKDIQTDTDNAVSCG